MYIKFKIKMLANSLRIYIYKLLITSDGSINFKEPSILKSNINSIKKSC